MIKVEINIPGLEEVRSHLPRVYSQEERMANALIAFDTKGQRTTVDEIGAEYSEPYKREALKNKYLSEVRRQAVVMGVFNNTDTADVWLWTCALTTMMSTLLLAFLVL